MKAIKILTIAALLVSFASCEEFQPVFTGTYEDPEYFEPVVMTPNKTIAEVKQMYIDNGNKPITIEKNVIIGGRVTTSDKVGNLYKSLYIQDKSAGIEIKIGKNGLYNEFKLGQMIYVDCNGLTVGDYNGMIQIGYSDPTGEYETSYMEHQYIIDAHVFKGAYGNPVEPVVITEADLKKKENLGRLVTIKDLTYGNLVFCLIYVNPNLTGEAKKKDWNRIFMDDEAGHNWGIDTWAMSESLFKKNLEAGKFDDADLKDAAGNTITVKDLKRPDGTYAITPTAYSVSQYFQMGKSFVQVRSSGYARFSDENIFDEYENLSDEDKAKKKFDFTGILTEYQGEAQFTLIDLDGVHIHD